MDSNGPKLDRIKTLLAAYGSDPCQWPEEEQRHMGALFNAGSDADAMREEARILDEILLAAKPVPPPSHDLAARIVMEATQHDQLPPYMPEQAADFGPRAAPGLAARLKARLGRIWDGLSPGHVLAPAMGVCAMLAITVMVANSSIGSGILNDQINAVRGIATPANAEVQALLEDPLDEMYLEISVMTEEAIGFDERDL